MATIKYILQSKSENAPIYLRLSLSQNKQVKRKTGKSIAPKDWSKTTGLPLNRKTQPIIELTKQLRALSSFVYDEVNKVNESDIDGKWLENVINIHFKKIDPDKLNGLIAYGRKFIEDLPFKSRNGKQGVGKSTIKKYTTIVNKLEKLEQQRKEKILLSDVDLNFQTELTKFFSKTEKLNDNTVGRYLKFVKTICIDAKKNGINVNNQIEHFQGFTRKSPKIVLSFDELEEIKKVELENDNLKIARDWLIIGCYTGQRVSDLLRMNKSFIQTIEGLEFIVLKQVKTEKTVQIPIHYEVSEILKKYNGHFPPLYSSNLESNKALFNKNLKQLCKKAEINDIVEGNLYDKTTERTISGKHEKHKLVSSHICRRSFATNFYSLKEYPTPLLMNITAHSTEKMFLEYIGKKPIDYSLQLAKIWAKKGKGINNNVTS